MKDSEVPSLHDVACGISMSVEKQAVSHDRTGRAGILHVSGTPFLHAKKRAGYLGDSIPSSLCPFQLCRVGKRLECAWDIVFGQGGYAKVFYGQVLPFRVEVSGHITLVWRAMRPLLSPLSQASSLLAYNPFHNLTLASRDCAALAWQMMVKTAEIWGLARPCAVKVLQDSSPNKGAYGSRSVEHEVLITMHISTACASCPHIGKAHGFDLAGQLTPLMQSPADARPCASADCPSSACTDPDAVLLVLEAYTLDLTHHIELHKQHCPDTKEFPCRNCVRSTHDDCRTLTSAARGTQLDSPTGQVVSLWEYATRLRESRLVMSVSELMRIALELTEAVHALHTVAHVMHLDIKPQNVLLDSQFQVKLLDFGLSAAFKPERPFIILQSKGRGTRPYTAPELLVGSSGTVSPAADIYSLGCCLVAVSAQSRGIGASREPPDIFGLLKKGVKRHTDLSPFAPKELHSLLKACLSEHAFERPTSYQVLQQLKVVSSEHISSLKLQRTQACTPTPPIPVATVPAPAQKTALQPLQSFPVIQDEVRGEAAGSAAQPSTLLPCDVERQRPASPALQLCHPLPSQSLSLTGSDVMRGGATCVPSVGRSRASAQLLASPCIGSNAGDSSSASRPGISGMWSSSRATDTQRAYTLHTSEVACSGGLVGDGCRRMPYTTSVRFGLAAAMRPLSAQSSSVSGWLSEGSTSMSFASHATAY